MICFRKYEYVFVFWIISGIEIRLQGPLPWEKMSGQRQKISYKNIFYTWSFATVLRYQYWLKYNDSPYDQAKGNLHW